MKIYCALSLGLILTTSSLFGADDDVLKTQTDKASYAIGHDIGSSLTRDGLKVSVEQLILGLQHAIAGKEPLLTKDEMRAALIAEQKALEERAMAEQKKIADDNQKKADEFLAANKKKKGVITTDTGLQYEIVAKGDGPSPKETDTVKAHYHGTLLDESVFDSSINRKEPIVIPVNRVIPGWTEALTKMKVGDKWKLYIPPALAYGENPRPGGPIGPNELLIFDIELLSIEE